MVPWSLRSRGRLEQGPPVKAGIESSALVENAVRWVVMNPARIVLLVLVFAPACSRTPEASQSVVVSSPTAAKEEPVVAETAGNPFTNRIRCGDAVCDAATHVCCGFSSDYGCAKRVPIGTGKVDQEKAAPLIESCEQSVESQYSFDTLILCDDSTDCADGQVCCSQWLWSGAALLACVPSSASGELVCDFNERCEGETCRTADTHCVKGECRRKDVHVSCAGKRCGGSAPTCCHHVLDAAPTCESKCEPRNEDDRVAEFECSDSSHCPPGATCQSGMFGSYCATLIDGANALVLCASDGDCRRDGCAWLGIQKPPKCVEGPKPGFRVCSCE